ncbi:MAG: hypothetical protein U0V87_12505 [Acidobacteriota bacterium]
MYVERPDVESFVAPAMPVLSPSRPPATGGGSVGVPQDSVDFGSTGSAVNPPTSSGSTSAPAVDGAVIDSGSIVAAPIGTTPIGGARHGGVIDPTTGPVSPVGGLPVGGPIGSTGPVALPKPIDGSGAVTGTTPPDATRSLLIPVGNAKSARRRLSKELNALRIAVRRELKQQFGDRLKSDPALKLKARELVRNFQNQLRSAFEQAGGKGHNEIDGNELLAGLKQAFNDLSSGLSAAVGVTLAPTSASTASSGVTSNPPAPTSNGAASASLTTSPDVSGAAPLPDVVSDIRFDKISALFNQRYQRIESYLTDQSLATATAQATLATRRSSATPSVLPVGSGLNIAV